MRLSIVVLIAVIAIGSVIIILGFLTNQEIIEISDQYEKLENYKTELEKINQYNQQILDDLEEQIKNSDDSSLEQIREEIDVVKRIINENKAELEKVIERLSKIEPTSWTIDSIFGKIYIIIISNLKKIPLSITKDIFPFLVGSIVEFITTLNYFEIFLIHIVTKNIFLVGNSSEINNNWSSFTCNHFFDK